MITLLLLVVLCFAEVNAHGTTIYDQTHKVAGGDVCVSVELDNRLYETGDPARVTVDLRVSGHGDRRAVDVGTGVGRHVFDVRFDGVPTGDAVIRLTMYGEGRTRVQNVALKTCERYNQSPSHFRRPL